MRYLKFDRSVQGYIWVSGPEAGAVSFSDEEIAAIDARGGFYGFVSIDENGKLVKDNAAIDAYVLPLAKEAKRDEIRAAFSAAEVEPIPDPLGGVHTWHGGYNSAEKLHNARTMAIEAGLTEVTFYDTGNVGHTLTLDQAKAVALTVGGKYQQDFAKKQDLMRQIDVATTSSEIDAIKWDKVPF